MATGTTPSGSAFVFKIPSGGRQESTYAPSGYAAAYAQGKGIMDMLDWQDARRKDEMSEQIAMSRERRALESEKLAEEKAAREDARLELQSRRQMDAQDRERLKQEKLDQMSDTLGKVTSAIDDVDTLHKNAGNMLDDIRHSQEFHQLAVNAGTRAALMDAFKAKADEIKGIHTGIQHEAKSKYGIEADLSNFPTDEKGRYDFNKGYREYLPAMAQQASQAAEQEYQSAPDKPGFTKYAELDAYGRPLVKFVKTEDLNKQKLEEQRVARGGQLQAIAAMQASRQELSSALGGFKQKELENPNGYLDANGKPTKDIKNAVTAIWKVKGKEVARMPENERQARVQKVGVISQNIEDFGKMAYSPTSAAATSAPSGQPAAPTQPTAPAEQPSTPQEPSAPSSPTSPYSPDNPHAPEAQKQSESDRAAKQAQDAKKAIQEQSKISGKMANEKVKARKELADAERDLEYARNLKPSTSIQDYEAPTPEEAAKQFEEAKQKVDAAKAKMLWFTAQDPLSAKLYLRELSGDELETFKRDYLGPAIFNEAGGDPKKAEDIARERGYDFFLSQ